MNELWRGSIVFMTGAMMVVALWFVFIGRELGHERLEMKADEALTHALTHEVDAQGWKNRIVVLEDQVAKLLGTPSSRPDPFTGTMGEALEKRLLDRIKAIETHLSLDPAADDPWGPREAK